ncbi:MAG: hypothetical protein B0D91_13370 [Oceanospirillales bacterium LUC14_002_19_P2]|nr:MAG: hypothetical protein B0D91_13370 [Oceanospirillales bacterium LUC14_002_19_P2]
MSSTEHTHHRQLMALMDIGSLAMTMAQELQELYDESVQQGQPLESVRALIADWEKVYRRHRETAGL